MRKINALSWFNDLSIKRKITYLFLPLAIIPMIAFALLSTQLYEKSIIKRSLDTMSYNDILISNQIESILGQAESCSTYLTISINNMVNQSQNRADSMNSVKFNSQLTNELSYAKLIFQDIDAIAFINTSDKVYLSDYNLIYDLSYLKNSPLMVELEQSSGNNIWHDISKQLWMTTSRQNAMVTLSKKVWNIYTGETIGYLFIHISENRFSQLFEDQQATYDIVNKHGVIVSSNNRDTLFNAITEKSMKAFLSDASKTSTLLNINHETTMVSKRSVLDMGWTLLSRANLDSYTADMRNLLLLTLVMLLSIIFLDIAMSSVLTQWITKPITLLMGGLEHIAEGRFDYRFNMKTNDEIGLFAKQFNHMSAQIGDLLKRVTKEEEKKRAYELALIQEQIKPHFLYNTLDIIMKLIELGQSKKAQKATKRLADFYRHSLSGGADIVSVAEELSMTKDYLELQKIRYSESFDYHIEVSEQVLDLYIPKLTLQPLVENAIYHGLKYRSDSGLIHISAAFENASWLLIVHDNGAGLKAETLNNLNAALDYSLEAMAESSSLHKDSLKHFGIRNVNHRIKLFFGAEYGLYYESEEQMGTTVKIRLPQGGTHD